jgi:WD40 repeat protein
MSLTIVKLSAVFVLGIGALAAGAGALAHWKATSQAAAISNSRDSDPPAKAPPLATKDAGKAAFKLALDEKVVTLAADSGRAGEKPARKDLYGDPLPAGAIARLGTSRLQHDGKVNALAYSPDGKWLASAGADAVIRLWDAETGKGGFELKGHQGAIQGLAFVPAGEGKPAQVLISAGFDKTIRFWDLKTGQELNHVINHPEVPATLAVSPDGKLLASGGNRESHIFLWKVEDGKEVRRWKAHQGGVTSLAFGPDGKSLASAGMAQREWPPAKPDEVSDDYAVALWETETGHVRHTFARNASVAWVVAFSPDGKLLAGSSFDKMKGRSVILWNPETGKQLRTLGGRIPFIDPRCLLFSKDSKTLVVGNHFEIKFFDTGTGAEQRGLPNTFTDQVHVLAFSPDGRSLASSGEKGRIILWDVARRSARLADRGHTVPVTSVAVAPDGKTIATGTFGEPAWLWDRATSKPLRQLKRENLQSAAMVWCLAFSPDGCTIALSHQHFGIIFWDVSSGEFQDHISAKNYDRIVSVAYSPDGKWLASESIDQPYASLWEIATGELKRKFERGTEDRGFSVAISPDNRLLASIASNGLNVWELDSGKLVYRKADAGGMCVAFSPGGFLVATGGGKVFDAFTGAELAKFENQLHHNAGKSIAFSPDGRLLAVADVNRVRLWDVAGRRELRGFEGHRGIITSLAFIPDGKALATGSEDGTALIWDLQGVMPEMKDSDPKPRWEDLQSRDRLRAYGAFCRLRAAPDAALALLKTYLKPAAAPSSERLADLIKNLDSASFKVREQAGQELREHGLAAEKALRQAAKNKPSLEAERRIAKLLTDLDDIWAQSLVALKLLEELPPASARPLLESLIKGAPDSRLTREANAVLQRLAKRGQDAKP